eukprot:363791-Chlamydomonas_euryale.AAC.2
MQCPHVLSVQLSAVVPQHHVCVLGQQLSLGPVCMLRQAPALRRMLPFQQLGLGPVACHTKALLHGACCLTGIKDVLDEFKAPKWLFRSVGAVILGGQVIARIVKGVHSSARDSQYRSSRSPSMRLPRSPSQPHKAYSLQYKPCEQPKEWCT